MAEEKVKKKLQWHPAFYAGLQIELEEERDKLIFTKFMVTHAFTNGILAR